jgi:hypothetical protein
MRLSVLSAVMLALPLPAVAPVYGTTYVGCHPTDAPYVTPERCDESACCQQAKTAVPKQSGKTGATPVDPDRQIVFKVDGLACPAVKGIGCGHMLQGVLASLDKIDGVGASSANYTGTMIRVSVGSEPDRGKVAARVQKVLTDKANKAVRLVGGEFKRALAREEWREAARIGELSAIEFRTLALHRVKTFAKAEKLDKKAADKLVEIAEQQWARICKEAKNDGATQPEDWRERTLAAFPAFLEQAKEVLTTEQVERFQRALMDPCCGGDAPEAPPASAPPEKAV